MARRRQAGNHISVLDAQIAACAMVAKAALATRNAGGFGGVQLRRVINPWDPTTW
ncbi:MAG: hypothetical protein LBG60_12135 [Bifidobacteriaceae bacterium]|nr:hypothetical protein [Bifidobacteriaceae bacterium]